MNKAYLKKLDKKFDRIFKGKFSTSRLTNTSKSVYSFEGEILSEEDDEYDSDSQYDDDIKDNKSRYANDENHINEEDEILSSNSN